ncbi:MAG: glycosyltransferase family 2 protein [Rhodospirillales bacterium]|jgi:glycosyltransferase involved in cell wall biosynthesis|nr:glycosyltransferase [Rhodospirillaceae bacterium]MDP6428873.1 glycosyltransferase family 2 protein [Rhodospirillales bacterium]MDP6644754.1 glycosyltransferase family 2 protein [Rhodospirillales bacterium]MDP6840486.1 glycosyltransferase family 2 protein [Rhodospirillales bacterium]
MIISIVTLSFNQAEFLERAIRSVVEQDYGDIEYIVVDPGSTDGSRDIIERYRDRIATLILDPDDGPADGLNKGFAAASGDIFAYINADDALLPGALRAVANYFRAQPDTDVVTGHGYIVDGEGKVLRRFLSAPFSLWRFAYGHSVVIQQSTFFRKWAFEKAGGFNTRNRTSWDAELLLEMALAGGKVRLADGYWSFFTLHPDSISGSQRLAEESKVNHRRYFERVLGRSPRAGDAILGRAAWAGRWLADPARAISMFNDRIAGPPPLPHTEWL